MVDSAIDQGDPTPATLPPAPSPPASPAPLWRRILLWAGLVLVGLAALAVAMVFVLDTRPGRAFVAKQIGGLPFENGLAIGVGRIDGSLYGAMTIRDLTLSDPQGVFARAPAVRLDWRPFAFVRNHVDIRALDIPEARLARLPAFRDTPPTNDPLLPDIDIDIDRLRLGRLLVEPAVTGQRHIATLSGEVHIADQRARILANGATVRGAGVAGGDRLALTLNAVPDANRFAVDATLSAPAGGLVAGLAGLTAPLSARLAGRGDWARWNGRLTGTLGAETIAGLDLAAQDGRFRLTGTARPGLLLTGPSRNLLEPVTRIDATARLAERRADVTLRVGSDNFTATGKGLLDFAESRFGDTEVELALLKPSVLAERLVSDGLTAQLRLNGAFAAPRVRYALNAATLGFDDILIRRLRATGEATVDADRILIPVAATAASIAGLDAAAGGTIANVRLNGDVAIAGPRILSDNMKVRSDRIDATAILLADLSEGLYTGAFQGRVDDYRVDSVGLFNLDTRADLKTASGGGFALVGRVRARSTRLFNEGVRDFLGGNTLIAADVAYGSDGVARVTRLNVSAPQFRLTEGQGSYTAAGGIRFAGRGRSDVYGPLAVQVSGTLGAPVARLQASRPGLGVGLVDLDAMLRGTPGGRYAVTARGGTDYGPFTADVLVATGSQLAIDIRRANFAGVVIAGQLRQSAAGPFAGRLTANGSGINGVVLLSASGRYQRALIDATARNAVFAGPADLAIGRAIIDADLLLTEQPQLVADVQLADTRIATTEIAAARAKIDYRGGRGSARLLAEGTSGVPFRIAGNAAFSPELWRVTLNGRASGVDFRTSRPALIRIDKGSYNLAPATIALTNGSLQLAGRYGGGGYELQSRLNTVDLALVNFVTPSLGLGGRVSGSLDFAQASASAFPRADARLTLDDFTRTTLASVSQPVDANLVGRLLPNGGNARAILRRRGAVIGRLAADLTPLPPASGAWTTRLLGAPLSGGVRYNGPAETLFSFAGLAGQSVSGPIGVAADFSGRVQSPSLAGLVRANALTYNNEAYGTRLTDMRIDGRFTNDRFVLTALTAEAGDGDISGSGYASLNAAAGYPIDLRFDFRNAQLAGGEDLSASATGDLRLVNLPGTPAQISGTLRLPETRYRIVRQGSAEISELTGVRRLQPVGRRRIAGDAAEAPGALPADWALDIALTAPERLYVSGMGLESEWSTNLRVGGTTGAPRVSGTVDLVRGTLGFAGRSFMLTEGRVAFTGAPAINPSITLAANAEVEGVTTIIQVGGAAFDPQISFASTPALPQDEIVARILFGSSVTNLDAVQAIQLASSLNSLRGGSGGLNPLGTLQRATGIDRLRILGPDSNSGRGTALAAGQYITDDVYVEIISDSRGFTATQLEVTLTPALSVLSSFGSFGGSNVTVRYKRDY